MGKPDEALSVCLNAKDLLYSDNVVHIDDLTLSTLQIVFQRLDRCLSTFLFSFKFHYLVLATYIFEHLEFCGHIFLQWIWLLLVMSMLVENIQTT